MKDESSSGTHPSSFILHPSPRGSIEHFGELKADGSTACGCWIYSGVYHGFNKANTREPRGRYAHGWGYAWPLDRRILYNRASADPDGKPWSERKALVWWDDEKREWAGHDVPDFTRGKAPDSSSTATSAFSAGSPASVTVPSSVPVTTPWMALRSVVTSPTLP